MFSLLPRASRSRQAHLCTSMCAYHVRLRTFDCMLTDHHHIIITTTTTSTADCTNNVHAKVGLPARMHCVMFVWIGSCARIVSGSSAARFIRASPADVLDGNGSHIQKYRIARATQWKCPLVLVSARTIRLRVLALIAPHTRRQHLPAMSTPR